MNEQKVYKIFQYDEGRNTIKNLHHGVNGSKTIPWGKWLIADEKMVIDGSGGTRYLSGIHCFADIKTLKRYTKFSKPNLVICECLARNTRVKEHARVHVLLASQLKVLGIVERMS